jgi:peptidoglycan/LPS O-acetylase OafA/YrhL
LVLLFLQAWWPRFAMLWNFPAWSLSVECLFYAVFPHMARVIARAPRATLFAVTYAMIVAATVYRSEFLSSPGPIPLEGRPDLHFQAYFPLLHLPLFVFGMALGRLFLFGSAISTRMHTVMLWAGICVLLLIFCGSRLFPWWMRSEAVLVLVFAPIILGGAGASSQRLAWPGFVLLGEASYVMYILHIPLRLWWEGSQQLVGFRFQAWLNVLLYFVVVVVVSILVYRHVETPLRHWINKQKSFCYRGSVVPSHREA